MLSETISAKHVTFTPSGVCSKCIDFDIASDGTIHNIRFTGGCHGNTQGVSALAEGASACDVAARLRGIDCRGRGTSCPDQLARAIEGALIN